MLQEGNGILTGCIKVDMYFMRIRTEAAAMALRVVNLDRRTRKHGVLLQHRYHPFETLLRPIIVSTVAWDAPNVSGVYGYSRGTEIGAYLPGVSVPPRFVKLYVEPHRIRRP
jgi:hypothetical protein